MLDAVRLYAEIVEAHTRLLQHTLNMLNQPNVNEDALSQYRLYHHRIRHMPSCDEADEIPVPLCHDLRIHRRKLGNVRFPPQRLDPRRIVVVVGNEAIGGCVWVHQISSTELGQVSPCWLVPLPLSPRPSQQPSP